MRAFLRRLTELVARHIADAHALLAGLFEQPLQAIVGPLCHPDFLGAARLDRLEHGIDAVDDHGSIQNAECRTFLNSFCIMHSALPRELAGRHAFRLTRASSSSDRAATCRDCT